MLGQEVSLSVYFGHGKTQVVLDCHCSYLLHERRRRTSIITRIFRPLQKSLLRATVFDLFHLFHLH